MSIEGKTLNKSETRLLIGIAMILVCCSCKTKPLLISPLDPPRYIPKDREIAILKPMVFFKRIQDEQPLLPSDYQGEEIEGYVLRETIKTLSSGGQAFMILGQDEEPQQTLINDDLKGQFNKWPRKVIEPEDFLTLENYIAAPPELALVQTVHVKVGQEAAWNPLSGFIVSANSSTLFQVALIDCRNKTVLWKQRVLLRQIPKLGSKSLAESLALLYSNFPIGKERE